MDIIRAENIDANILNDLLSFNPESRFYQTAGYLKVIKEVFGYKSVHILIKDNDKIIAFFPMFVVKNLLFNKIVSIPFAEYGGIISNSSEKLDFSLISKYLNDLVTETKVDYIEINGGLGLSLDIMRKYFYEKIFQSYAELDLLTEEQIWLNFDRQIRKAINKSKEYGLECFNEESTESIVKYFYPLYLKSQRRMGSPPLQLDYFISCYKHLKDNIKIFYVKDSDRIIAALLGYRFNNRVYIQVIASDEREHRKRAVDLAHWEFIKWSIKNNVHFFDFGPVRYDGQRKYKLKWNTKLKDYRYFYFFKSDKKRVKIPEPLTPLTLNIQYLKLLWRIQPSIFKYKLGPLIRKGIAK